METKTCTRCNRSFPISEFNWKVKAKGKRHVCCKYCQRELQNAFYRNSPEYQDKIKAASARRKKEVKRLYFEYLKQQRCMDCGETDPVVLTHDHRDPSQKKECVSVMISQNGWKTIQAEIAKCDVVCFNCHARRTAKTQKWYENYE